MDRTRLQNLVNDDERMRALIGRTVYYANQHYEICDVLIEERQLILASSDAEMVQDDSYGRPCRKVPAYHCLVFKDESGAPSHIWNELVFSDGPPDKSTDCNN